MKLNMFNILASSTSEGILPGSAEYDFGGAGITALVSILIVFAVLVVIILITHLLFLAMNKIKDKIAKSDSKFARFFKKNQKSANNEPIKVNKVEIVDDDMMAAVLAATIDYQSEVKSDVRLVSVKEIK